VSDLAGAATVDDPDEVPTIHGCPSALSSGQLVLFVGRGAYLEVFSALRRDGYDLCADVTAVDYLAHPGRPLPLGVDAERFEVVVNLLDRGDGADRPPRRLRARCQVPEDDPVVPSLFGVWPGSDAMEREVYDMMGISFSGHPDLSRILMPDDWEGHPLRKDYPVGRVPVQFKQAPAAR